MSQFVRLKELKSGYFGLFLDNQFDLLSFTASLTDVEAAKLTLQVEFNIEVSVGDLPGFVGQELLKELEEIVRATEHVIEVFESWASVSKD